MLFANENFIEFKPGWSAYNEIAENWNKAIEFHLDEVGNCVDANFSSNNENSYTKTATCIYNYLGNRLKLYDVDYEKVGDELYFRYEQLFEIGRNAGFHIITLNTTRSNSEYKDARKKLLEQVDKFTEYYYDSLFLGTKDVMEKVAFEAEQLHADYLASFILEEENNENEKITEPEFADDEILQASSGTGFFINDEGYIVTNNHVIESCGEMKFFNMGVEMPAQVIASDSINDIAILSSTLKETNYFTLRSNDVERTENIKAIGYGFGKAYSSDVKVTAGIVSSLAGYADNYSEFQMDAAIQSGNSGGPVIDDSGYLVGISVAALDSIGVLEDTGTLPQNVNYAIKASTLKQFLDSNEIYYELSKNSFLPKFFNNSPNLNEVIDEGTVYLSCYMTYAQIKENKEKKVMFKNIE